jgi:hypothetical protein
MTRQTIPLEMLRIASPCHVAWEDMAGTNRMRFCQVCQEVVYDLSAMTRKEPAKLIRQKNGKACVRLYRRRDGTVLTRDCPVGARARRQRLCLFAAGSCLVAILAWGSALFCDYLGRGSGRRAPTETVKPREPPGCLIQGGIDQLLLPPGGDEDEIL